MGKIATIIATDIQNETVTITVEYPLDSGAITEQYSFDHVPSQEEIGVLVYQKWSKLENIANNKDQLTVGLEITPIDPQQLIEEKQKELEAQKEKERALKREAEAKAFEEETARLAAEEQRTTEEIATFPKKCHIRTFNFSDETHIEYHSICDGKDYTREDKPNNEMGLLSGAYVRDALGKEKIVETIDSIHYVKN